MRPLIGIPAGEIRNRIESWSPHAYGQGHTYTDAIINAGGVPIILPLTDDVAVLRELYQRCDGLMFAGGNDIDPRYYGQTPHETTRDFSRLRDEQEITLMKHALADDKPVLAICRGMQLLNVVCGGSLHQHIPHHIPGAQDHEDSTKRKDIYHIAHQLKLDNNSQLAHIVGRIKLGANSHHHQAVDTLGTELRPTAWAEDGVVEAIEHTAKRFAIGVQLHPESLEAAVEPAWAKLFKAFVAAA